MRKDSFFIEPQSSRLRLLWVVLLPLRLIVHLGDWRSREVRRNCYSISVECVEAAHDPDSFEVEQRRDF